MGVGEEVTSNAWKGENFHYVPHSRLKYLQKKKIGVLMLNVE